MLETGMTSFGKNRKSCSGTSADDVQEGESVIIVVWINSSEEVQERTSTAAFWAQG